MYQDSGEDKLTVTESVKIGGIVVSSRDPQTVSEGNLMIQDGTGKHSGIIIYSKSIWGLCNFGDSVEVELKGGVLETYYGLTQYKPTGDAQFKLLKEKAAPSLCHQDQAVMPQKAELFAGSIRENLLWGKAL